MMIILIGGADFDLLIEASYCIDDGEGVIVEAIGLARDRRQGTGVDSSPKQQWTLHSVIRESACQQNVPMER
jgi:hypothetical protein